MDGEETDEKVEQPAATDTTAQRAFFDRLVAALRADERVLAAWTIGSLARGVADAYSDVDVLIAVRDPEFAALVADWPAFVARLAPTVFARRIGAADKPTITAITPDWLRFDLTLASAADPRPHGYDARPLFVRDGIDPPTRFTPPAARDPLAGLPASVEEFLRVLGLLPVAVGRGEFIAGLTPTMLLRGHLIELMLLENDAPRGGAKRLNPLLTAEQRAALTGLPPLTPTRAAVIAGHLACARLFLPRARRLLAARGLPYPEPFERATLDYLRRTLDLTL